MLEDKMVLVVDDDIVNLEIISEMLEDEKMKVITAGNGKLALEEIKKAGAEIKLIILDWMMPVMNGMELLGIIKKDFRYRDIPVIMQTAKAYSDDMVSGIDAGADQYLTKPFTKEVLLSMVKSSLAKEERLSSVSEKAEQLVKGYREKAMKFFMEGKEIRFDLETYKKFNDFFIASMSCTHYEELGTLLLNTVKQFEFDSAGENAEDRKLRCSVRLTGGEEVNVSDRGVSSSFDKLLLQRVMESGDLIVKGSYTAIPSRSGHTAIMIRNTPRKEDEAEKAVNIFSVLLEIFEERLVHFENEQAIAKKNEELEKKTGQIKTVVRSCGMELNNVNETYQWMKERQMELMEQIADKIIASVSGLTLEQKEQIQNAAGDLLITSMELYSSDQITDQKFLLTIKKLDELIREKNQEQSNLEPEQLSGESQDSVDELLRSLGM